MPTYYYISLQQRNGEQIKVTTHLEVWTLCKLRHENPSGLLINMEMFLQYFLLINSSFDLKF